MKCIRGKWESIISYIIWNNIFHAEAVSNPGFSRRGANPKGGESQPIIWSKNFRKLPVIEVV